MELEILGSWVLVELSQLGIKLGLLPPDNRIQGSVNLDLANAEVEVEDNASVFLNSEALARPAISSLKVIQVLDQLLGPVEPKDVHR